MLASRFLPLSQHHSGNSASSRFHPCPFPPSFLPRSGRPRPRLPASPTPFFSTAAAATFLSFLSAEGGQGLERRGLGGKGRGGGRSIETRRRRGRMGNCFRSSSPSQNPPDSKPLSSGKWTSGTPSTTLSNIPSSLGSRITEDGQILPTPNLRVFTFAEMKSTTRNFKPDTVLGEGGFGKVFKGWVDEKTLNPTKSGNGMMVAVKKLNPESMQGYEEWQSEVDFLGRLSHPNLVKLLGYCFEDKELLLVYEFMARGSLENHLFRRGTSQQPLSWMIRLKIALGAARGLAFLHTSEKQVIYRDFKASNILLDSNYNAKLSDFGLAKNGPSNGDSHVTTRVMGTYGYAAPEYVATGHLYVKSDVYGFGVVLLEILSGLRAHDTNRPRGQQNLVDWAKPLLSDRRKLSQLVDVRLERQYPSRAAAQAAELTLKCLASDPKGRPSMKEVVEALEKIESVKSSSKSESKGTATQQPAGRGLRQRQSHRSPIHPRRDDSADGHYTRRTYA